MLMAYGCTHPCNGRAPQNCSTHGRQHILDMWQLAARSPGLPGLLTTCHTCSCLSTVMLLRLLVLDTQIHRHRQLQHSAILSHSQAEHYSGRDRYRMKQRAMSALCYKSSYSPPSHAQQSAVILGPRFAYHCPAAPATVADRACPRLSHAVFTSLPLLCGGWGCAVHVFWKLCSLFFVSRWLA